ncbi:MAG: hypothetical protein BWY69_00806 [Planctomycetes bacterium ADurb.Bin401]|jgi:hypothetical protein|nr:MAG: hypothetical protein BWY69_00806 [Planctomycetes bacterium ADurb.Bin401]
MALSKPYKGIPKTGLSECMRKWMQARSGSIGARRFFSFEIYTALNIPPGHEREKARNALRDFVRRGEVTFRFNRKRKRRHFSYNHAWYKTQKGDLRKKMFKAMYVLGSFSMSDIRRLTDIKDRHWISRIMRSLIKNGHLQQISRRLCAHGSGVEKVYRVLHRDTFKLNFLQ